MLYFLHLYLDLGFPVSKGAKAEHGGLSNHKTKQWKRQYTLICDLSRRMSSYMVTFKFLVSPLSVVAS